MMTEKKECKSHGEGAKEATWLQNYNGIKAYVDANGCLPIGESAIPLTTSVNSEFWIAAQKAAIRNGMMNEDKQQMLASIGIIYGKFKRNDDWQENYNFVKAYYEQHKQLPVGVNSQQMSTGSLSGFWIGLQRKKLKDNTLSAERVSLLKEIGIEYGQLENSWNANYNAVKMFFDEHHHLPVQDASILLPSGIQSRNWITNQKKILKTGTAPEDRVKLLNEIGIVAEADAPKPSKSKSEKVKKAAQTGSKPSRKVSKNPAEEWQECYDFVKRCLEESGTLPTGEKSTTMPNGVQTKSWIKQQRIALKESGLPADKVELLRAIGIVGNLMEQNWMRDYKCIKAYVYPFLHDADTFCLPSKYEGIPMTLIEAMGTGLPIISCAVGGIPDMLTDEQNALLVPPDVEGVAHGMEQLYSDRVLRKRLGMAAKKRSEDFSSETMAMKYINVYKMLEC